MSCAPCTVFLQYRATDFVVPGDGQLTITFKPASGGEAITHTVYDFKGSGGVAMAMFNTDAVSALFNSSLPI